MNCIIIPYLGSNQVSIATLMSLHSLFNTSQHQRAAVAFILVTVILDMVALGIVIPVLPKLIENFLSGDTARAALVYGVFGTAWALMQFLFSPLIGALSDRFGRRRIILLSNLGLGLDYLLMALAPNLVWLFIGRVIAGITAASISTSTAYIADVTPPEKRAASFGLIGAAFGIGFVMGPALGGILGDISPRLPFWVAAGFSLLNAAYGFFVLPESLAQDKRSPFEWRRANPIGSLALLRSHVDLLGLATVHFLSSLAHYVLPSTFVLYAGYRYGWSTRDVGLTLAGVGVASALVQGGLIRPAIRWLGERRALMLGLIAGATGFIVYGSAGKGVYFLIGVPIMAIWGLMGPSMQGLATKRVNVNEQGQLQGALSSIAGIAGLFGPALFTSVFAWSIHPHREWHLPGAAYFLAAMLLLGAGCVAYRTARAA